MGRVVFENGKQGEFFKQVRDSLGCTSDELGKLVGISGSSFRDWISERFLGEKRALEKLSRLSGVPLPKIVEVREENWSARKYARKGALARLQKYGPPGTPEGRRRGGIVSQRRRRENPEFYKALGVNGKQYKYLKLCFSNMSQPLRTFVHQSLRTNGFNPRYAIDRHVWLYSESESRRYLKVIGSSNERLLRKVRWYNGHRQGEWAGRQSTGLLNLQGKP